ncbi:unnamed protein product, partial [Phaeothamnion confervicola]
MNLRPPVGPPSRFLEFTIVGDGNCFFRSVAHRFFGNDALHMQVRDEVAQFAVANW